MIGGKVEGRLSGPFPDLKHPENGNFWNHSFVFLKYWEPEANTVVAMIIKPPVRVLQEGISPNKINANTIPYTGSKLAMMLANWVLT